MDEKILISKELFEEVKSFLYTRLNPKNDSVTEIRACKYWIEKMNLAEAEHEAEQERIAESEEREYVGE